MTCTSIALAGALALSPLAAHASTLVFESAGTVLLDSYEGKGTLAYYIDEDGDPTDVAAAAFFSDWGVEADLLISDATGILLGSSTVLSNSFGEDMLTIVFGDLRYPGPNGASPFLDSPTATAVFRYDRDFESAGEIPGVSLQIFAEDATDGGPVPSPVPLPASLPLLLAGLGAVAAVRRRKG